MRKPRLTTGFGEGFEAKFGVGRETEDAAGRMAGRAGRIAGREDFTATLTGSSENAEIESSSVEESGFLAGVGTGRFAGATLDLTTPKSRRLTIFLAPFSFSAIKTYDFTLFAVSIISLNWSNINDEAPMSNPFTPGMVR